MLGEDAQGFFYEVCNKAYANPALCLESETRIVVNKGDILDGEKR